MVLPQMNLPEPFRGYALTVTQLVDLVGTFQTAGSQMFIASFFKNDPETQALLASDVMPHFRA